jgi:putative acetyltransferase
LTDPAPAPIRPAAVGDADVIARIWHTGWIDGHEGHVPAQLVAHRDAAQFLTRARHRIESTWVAEAHGAVAGFVVVLDDEVEQIFVDASARGTGVATALLRAGEAEIRNAGYPQAWLAVVAGNARARAFYARQGWRDAGPFSYLAETQAGPIAVPSHRYEIDL